MQTRHQELLVGPRLGAGPLGEPGDRLAQGGRFEGRVRTGTSAPRSRSAEAPVRAVTAVRSLIDSVLTTVLRTTMSRRGEPDNR